MKKISETKKYNEFNHYEDELRVRGYSKKSIEAYAYFNQRLLKFTGKKTREINQGDIKRFLLNLIDNYGAKAATINLAISSFKSYYLEYRGRKFVKSLKRSKGEKKVPVYLTKKEVLAMVDSVSNAKHKLLIELLYSSGLRVGEAVKLKIEDIYFNEGFLLVKQGKGKKDRYVIMSNKFVNDLIKFLENRNDNNPYIFVSNHDKKSNISNHISIRTAEKIVKIAAKRAGIKRRVFPHALRSSFATQLYRNGVDVFSIQKLMGHSRTETTKGYTKTDFNMINSITSPLD